MRWSCTRRRLVLAALLPAVLAACGGTPSRLPVACSTPGLLSDGADLTRYRPGSVRDLTTLEWDARLSGLTGGCDRGSDNRSIIMTLIVGFEVERGGSSDTRVIDLPWFVAVVDAKTDQVMSRQTFVDRVSFSRNETRISGQSEPVKLTLPVGENRKAQDYKILVSFALTPEDLELNRRRGPR
jgi:hypothetical protein